MRSRRIQTTRNAALRQKIRCERPKPMTAGIVLPGNAREPRLCMRRGRLSEHFDFRLPRIPCRDNPFQHPSPAEVEAVEVGEFAVGLIRAFHGCDRERNAKGWQSAFEPVREVFGFHDAAHEVGFGEGRGEEVVAGRFVPEGEADIVAVEGKGSLAEEGDEGFVVRQGSPVEGEAHREGSLGVFAGADRMGKLRKPLGETVAGKAFERFECGHERGGFRYVPFAKFGGELEQPGESVRAFEAFATRFGDEANFEGEVFGGEAALKGGEGLRCEGFVREKAGEASESPMAVDGGVPVEAAEEGGGLLARGEDVAGVEEEGDGVVGKLAVNAIESEAGKPRRKGNP